MLMERLDEYQHLTEETDVIQPSDKFTYYPLGLNGESGVVADKIKKIIRDKQGHMDKQDRDAIALELGDCMWYVARMAAYLGYPLSQIAQMNIDKLQSRKQRDKISGSGDYR